MSMRGEDSLPIGRPRPWRHLRRSGEYPNCVKLKSGAVIGDSLDCESPGWVQPCARWPLGGVLTREINSTVDGDHAEAVTIGYRRDWDLPKHQTIDMSVYKLFPSQEEVELSG